MGNGGSAVCPGDQVVLLCTAASDASSIRWNAGTTNEKTYFPGDPVNVSVTISQYEYTLLSTGPMVIKMRIPSFQSNASVQCSEYNISSAMSSVTAALTLAGTAFHLSYLACCLKGSFFFFFFSFFFLSSAYNAGCHAHQLRAKLCDAAVE